MGKSGSSCFNIMGCGRGSGDHDDPEPSESGASSDKRRWSFRKRSARHRVLSNTVISEPLPVVSINKESPDDSCNTSNPPVNSFSLEKVPSPKKTDDIPLQSLDAVDTKLVDASVATEDTIKPAPVVQETAASVIQAAVRGYLARKEMQKLKSVIKLQAAARGHLVRRQAAGTLRCIHAIIKLQGLVRARLVRQSVENSTNQQKFDAAHWTDNELAKSLDKESYGAKQKKSYSSTEKFLTNGFARQLLVSTPKTKPIHIHCDPARSDSAWQWLERWMALSPSKDGQEQELSLMPAYQERRKSAELVSFEVADEASTAVDIVSADAKSAPVLLAQTEDLTVDGACDFEFQAPKPVLAECFSPQAKDDHEHHKNDVLDVTPEDYAKNKNVKETSASNTTVEAKSASILQSSDVFDEPEKRSDHLTERTPSHSVESDDKKPVFGTRKNCNPAFAAAQAKFEELSSAGSLRSKSFSQDVSVGSRSENLPCDSVVEGNINITEQSVSHDPRVQTATSECGTEISISSTLDSPDRSEIEGGEIVLEIEALERRDRDVNGDSNNSFKDLNSDAKNLSATEILQPSKLEETNENLTNLSVALDSVQMERKPSLENLAKPILSDTNVQDNIIDQEANRSTPEGSPRSHITAPESHGTPSSQISVDIKKSKVENSMHMKKQRSRVAGGKRSLSNLDTNSGGSSTENLPKDTKNVKRRNSFGMAISDHVEHEPRASTSNSLPNYMQATESARAKVANNSPKSSPDVHKDVYVRKRHSLPMGNGKQSSSPRMQRSSSQMQPNVKQNGTNSPHNSTERRWQR